MAEHPFASVYEESKSQNIQSHRGLCEEIRCVTHRSPSAISAEVRNRNGIIWERTSCVMDRKPLSFLRMLYQQKHHLLRLKGTESMLTDYKHSTGWKQTDKTAQLQTHATVGDKGRMTQRNEQQVQKAESKTTDDYSQALKPSGVCPAGFQTFLGPVTPIFFPFPPLWTRMSMTSILYLSHHRILDYLFSSITDPQSARHVAPNMYNNMDKNLKHNWLRLFR